MQIPNILIYAIPFAALIVLIEAVILFTKGKLIDIKDSMSSIILGLVKIIVSISTKSITVFFFFFIYNNYRVINLSIPTWVIWTLSFIGTDFSYYWLHRASHKIRWFWATHITHHSSKNFNLLVGIRHGWTSNVAGSMIFYLWLPLLGFNPIIIFTTMQINFLYTYLVHTEVIYKLSKPIEFIFVTPSHHRVHHGSNIEYLDANYGEVLIIWDRIFGTFIEERESPRYGLIEHKETYNPLQLAFSEWIQIVKDLFKAKTLKNALMYLFAAPGWSPDGSRKTTEDYKKEANINQTKNKSI